MKKLYAKLGAFGLVLIGLISAGCLVSGTFVIVKGFEVEFTADRGFYWCPIDMTVDPDWAEHQQDIDDLDALGLVFTIENTSDVAATFTISFATSSVPAITAVAPDAIPAGAVTVLSGLTVAAGETRNITYSESLGMIGDIAAIKAVVLTGRFDYFGTSTGGSGDDPFNITEGQIIVTVSASST
jgi:hypothetical protein